MMRFFVSRKDVVGANTLLARMLKKGIAPNGYIFTEMARLASKSNTPSLLQQILTAISVYNYRPNVVEWTVMMQTMCQFDPTQVHSIFAAMQKQNVKPDAMAYGTLMRAYAYFIPLIMLTKLAKMETSTTFKI